MSSIVIGTSGKKDLKVNVDVLLRTRMLVQAASGQGKSHFLRRLIEQLFGKVQVFVIDHEGEFSTLRPTFDFALIGEGGDALPDVRTAGLLAHRLLELNASTIFDLSEAFRAHPSQRRAWVKAFLLAMMEAPRRLWHPVAVIVDEAHKYCPEKDEAESAEAMTSLATDGRKREFCSIWATQRLAKLNKDAAAELLNKMIGGTSLDIDRKRAADDLGVYGKDLQPFHDEIKVIERGMFYVLGPAICKTRTLVHVGPVKTLPPKLGKRATAPSPPTEKIKGLLPKLADLPKEVEQKAQTESDLRAEIRSLKAQLKSDSVSLSAVPPHRTVRQIERKYAPVRRLLQEVVKVIGKVNAAGYEDAVIKPEEISKTLEAAAKEISRLAKAGLHRRSAEFEKLKKETNRLLANMRSVLQKEDLAANVDVKHNEPFSVGPRQSVRKEPIQISPLAAENGDLSRPQVAILKALTEAEAIGREGLGRAALAFFAGASPSSSGFEKNVSTLKTKGYVRYGAGSTVFLNDEGRSLVGSSSPIDSDQLFERVSELLSTPQSKILQVLREVYPESISRAELADRAGQSATSSGFEKNISTMSSRELLTYPQPGHVRCADWLFV